MKRKGFNILVWFILGFMLIGLFGVIIQDNCHQNERLVTEILQIEKDINENNVYPDRETIDRLYRWRNCIDSKYSFEGPSPEFIEAYDRVIKPL